MIPSEDDPELSSSPLSGTGGFFMAEQRRSQQEIARQLLLDRRTKMRFPCRLLATCRAGAGRTGVSWPGNVRDISLKGIGLVLPRQFSAGNILTAKLYHTEDKVLFTARVQVIFVRHDGTGWLHGCQFLERLTDQQLEPLTK